MCRKKIDFFLMCRKILPMCRKKRIFYFYVPENNDFFAYVPEKKDFFSYVPEKNDFFPYVPEKKTPLVPEKNSLLFMIHY